jgi:serine/threonine-protein kinase
MATVYLANDLKHDRLVAVKVLSQHVVDSADSARFHREIGIIARLQHPHVVPLFDSGESGGELFYVMPFVEGESLRHRIDRAGPLPLDAAVHVAAQVAAALDYAHLQGVIHRDIKPSNILLSADIAMVADFGIARALGPDTDQTLTVAGMPGTPAYMSPEHTEGPRAVGPPSDLYALGCMLYEMLTGVQPYPGPTFRDLMAQHVQGVIPSVRVVRQDVPEAVDAVVRRALAKAPADRFPTAGAFRGALLEAAVAAASGTTTPAQSTAAPVVVPAPASRSRLLQVGVAAGIAAIAVVAWLARDRAPIAGRTIALDANTIAVAPFDVLDSRDSLWRHGMVDVLSRNYDGAGPIRAVPPTTIIRAWSGRADGPSAQALADRTGAAYVVLGQMLRTGGDGIRCTISLYDARSGASAFDTEVSGDLSAIDRLTDTMTVQVLRHLGQDRAIAALPRATIGSRSLTALKLFLQGEQAYRRNDYMAARPAYEQAIELDSTFALAYRRMRGVTRLDEWDSTSLAWAARAGALNRGLSPRDSLLVLADSLAPLTSPFRPGGITAATYAAVQRRMAVLEEAARRYPDDPEVWNDIGEMRVHAGARIANNTLELALQAFERALRLDSAFASSYFHAIELSAALRAPAVAARLARSLLLIDPTSVHARLAAEFLDGAVPDQRLRALADTVPDPVAVRLAGYVLRLWPDSDESAARIYRYVRTRQDSGSIEEGRTRNLLRLYLMRRGHLRAANELSRGVDEAGARFFLQVALRGVVPRDSADRTIAGWLAGDRLDRLLLALSWYGEHRDTARLGEILSRCERSYAAASEGEAGRLQASACMTLSQAHLALARGDSASAARRFALGADSACGLTCSESRLLGAALLRQVGDVVAGARILDRTPPGPSNGDTYDALWALERAKLADRSDDRGRAIQEYRTVEGLWAAPDAELASYARQVRAALSRLGASRR